MNDTSATPQNESSHPNVWPGKLNRILIGAGVLVFGLIIVDRVVDMFAADDMPDRIEIATPINNTVDTAATEPVKTGTQQVAVAPDLAVAPADSSEEVVDVLAIEDIFGSPLVFVSTSEPLYVVTEDDRRFDVGSDIDGETTLAGITSQRVVVEKEGNLLVIRLPDPAVQ